MVSKAEGALSNIVVAQFAGPHGLRGEFKLRSFTEDPRSVFRYGSLSAPSGDGLTPRFVRQQKPGLFVCTAPEIETPEDCTRFKGARLHVQREGFDDLAGEDDFYIADLIGLDVRDPSGAAIGRVRAVQNYGAGDIIEVEGTPTGLVLVPFTRDAVPHVAITDHYIVINPPADDDDS
ncbi:MAG: ribosome maturation factor RimM [Pseudomonadota bacterium]